MKHLSPTDLTGQRNVLSIQRIFVKMTGSHAIALFLAECWYWQNRAKERGETRFHMPLTTQRHGTPSWEDYDLKRSHIDAARALLEPLGILKCHGSSFYNGFKTTWYELDLELLDEAVGRFKATGETLERTMTVAGWRVWRRKRSQRPLKGEQRSCRPIRAAAVVKSSTPASVPVDTVTAPQLCHPSPAVAVMERPTVTQPSITLPVSPAQWRDAGAIERAKIVDYVRWNHPSYYWREAYALGFGELFAPKNCDPGEFTDEAVNEALKHLRSTSQGSNAQPGDAKNWLRRACMFLKSFNEADFENGLNRLTAIREAISLQRARSSGGEVHPGDRQPPPSPYPKPSLTSEEARALSDEEIRSRWRDIPPDHPWQDWAQSRLRRQDQARRSGLPVPDTLIRKPGEPLDKGIRHKPGFDPTPYL
jgi:hypothetical protein